MSNEKFPRFECIVSGSGFGFVYVLSYPGSEKVKIGHSLNPNTRAKNIGGTLAPEKPVLEAYYWCSERREDVERRVHELEKQNRHNGEWFKLTIERAHQAIEASGAELGIEVKRVFENTARRPDLKSMTKEQRWQWLREKMK